MFLTVLSISTVNCNTRCDVREDVFPATEDSMPAREDTELPPELAEEVLLVDVKEEVVVEIDVVRVDVEEFAVALKDSDILLRFTADITLL